MPRPLVFFDIETGGLAPTSPIIQLSAIAVDVQTWTEMSPTFNRLIQFDEGDAELEALSINHYSRERWDAEARPLVAVLGDFAGWLRKFATIPMTSKRGSTYYLAQMAGYNSEGFDSDRIRRAFKDCGIFYPGHYRTLDVLQLAAWDALRKGELAPSLRLSDICQRYVIPVDGAHDALADVRMTIRLARIIMLEDATETFRPLLSQIPEGL